MKLKLEDLQTGTQYAVQVRAGRDGQFSEWSERFIFTTDQNLTAPAAPTGATWAVSGDAFVATWNPVTTDQLGASAIITSYEMEFTAGATVRYLPMTTLTGNTLTFTLSFAQNIALFTTPQPNVSFRVRAVNNKGVKGAWTGSLNAINPVPANVTGFTATATQDAVELAWTANTDADLDHYEVFVGTTAGFTPASGNRIFSGNVTRFRYLTTTYSLQYFKIRAIDKFNQASAADASASATPVSPFVVDTTAPATPTALAATITTNALTRSTTATVTWTMSSPPSDLSGFKIRYRQNGTTNWVYQDVGDSAARAAVVNGLVPYVNYDFQIAAYDFSNNLSAYSATATGTGATDSVPANVTGLAATPGKDSILYTWTAVADQDIKNYEVTFSTSPTFASGNITYLTGTSTTLTVGGLSTGTTYYARVRAVDFTGNTSAAFSSTVSATTGTYPSASPSDGVVPGTPSAPNVAGGLSYLYVTWAPVTTNASAGAQNDTVTYEVHLSTTTGFTPSGATKVTEVSGTSAIVDNLPGTTTPLSYGTTYYIKLIAKDRDGSGSASAQGSGQISKVASGDVTSIGADLIVPGTGFVNALVVNTGGSIQSSNWTSLSTGWKISPTGIEMNDSGSKIKADAIQAGTLGGASGSGIINIAAGSSLVLNGGYLKSNTYTGTSYNAGATAGFYLGNDGLVIAQGTVKAEAFAGGTFSAGTINIGAGGKIQGGSWYLDNTGLSIPTGAITATSLSLQNGSNIIAPEYADFEYATSFYVYGQTWSWGQNPNATASVVADSTARFNGQYAQFRTVSAATNPYLYLSPTTTTYNTVLEVGKTYIISAYVRNPLATATSVGLAVKRQSDGAVVTVVAPAAMTPSSTAWTRIYGTFTPQAGDGNYIVQVTTANVTASGQGFDVDGIQIEEQQTAAITPSPWKPPGYTAINGSQVRTGSIMSTAYAVVWNATTKAFVQDTTRPAWSINTAGAAQFGNLSVLGNIVVGNPDDATTSQSVMASSNFVPGASGWQLRGDGTAELRQLVADSVDGAAIKAKTLDAAALTATSVLSSEIVVTGSLHATGVMGEDIGIDADGFHVYGPYQVSITTRALTSNVVTLTAAQAHGFAAGNQVVVSGIGAPFDGTFTIATTPTSTTFTYNVTNANITSAAATGLAQSYSTDSAVQKPLLIEFPTDGTNPNIISGTLTADYLSVGNGATFRGTNNIEYGATLTVASAILAPKTAPNVVATYNEKSLSIPSSYQDIRGFAKGHDGNYYAYSYDNTTDRSWISRYSSTTYARLAGFLGYYSHVTSGSTYTSTDPQGLVYNSGTGRYYGLTNYQTTSGSTTTLKLRVTVYDTSFNTVATYDAKSLTNPSSYNWAALGWDHVNSQLMIAYYDDNANVTKAFSMTMTSGTPTANGTEVTLSVPSGGMLQGPIFVMRANNMDGAALDRIIIKDGASYQGSNGNVDRYLVFTNTGTYQANETWISYAGQHHGGYYDTSTNTIRALADTKFLEYQSGDSFWSNDSTISRQFYVGYSWYSSSTTNETDLSPRTKYQLKKRSAMKVTILPIPYVGVTTTPDQARVYVAQSSTTEPVLTNPVSTSWHLRQTVTYPSTVITITPVASPAGAQPHYTGQNDFSAAGTNPGQIISTTGNSYWKGDDTAQFYQLVLKSDVDASTSAGNKPPLRIGDPAGAHLRIDSNEIIAMSGNTGQQDLVLNAGGGTNIRRITGGNFIKTGVKTCTIGSANVTLGPFAVSFPVAFPSDNPVPTVMLTPDATVADAWVSVRNVTRTGFDIYARRTAANNLDVDWLAVSV